MRILSAVRRHWLFTTLFAIGVVLRVLTSIAYRPAIFYIDSLGSYLPTLDKLDPTGQDPIGYDILMLKPVLAIGDFATVASLQHLLGLAMAVITYALLVHKGAWRSLAALATVPILLDAYQLQIEHNIMSDPLFQFLLVVAFAVLAWPARPGWRTAVLSGLLLGIAVTVRQVGELLFLPAMGYLLLQGGNWRRRLMLAGTAVVAFALPVASYVGYYHHWTGEYGLTHVRGNTLYGRVATFANCDGLSLPDYERQLCPTQPLAQRLGPEYWAHDDAAPSRKIVINPPAAVSPDKAMRDFSIRIVRHQPLDFAWSVLGDAARVFSWQRTDGRDTGQPPITRWQFQPDYPTFPPLVTVDSIGAASQQYGGSKPAVSTPLARGLRWYQLHGGYTPGPAIALACLIALLASARLVRWRRTTAGGAADPVGAVARSAQAAAALYLGGAALVLLLADTFEFSWRFQLPAYVLLPAAGVLGLVGLVRRPAKQVAFPEPADSDALAEFRERYGEPSFPPVVVLIAAYNEAPTLGPVLDAIPASCLDQKIATLVVVDGATDATVEVSRAHGAYTCAIPVNRGQGAALRLGYYLARGAGQDGVGCRYIVTTDADGQYDISELPLLLKPLIADEADFVTGSRALGTNESTDPVRRLGTRVFAGLISVLCRHRVTDTSFGFRAMRAEVTGEVTLRQPQYQSAELLVGALSNGYRVLERPMTMRERGGGKSKKGNNLVYGLRYARVVLSTWARTWTVRRALGRSADPAART